MAMLHSDRDPEGHPQLGAPINSKWDLHTPKHDVSEHCKVITYSKKKILSHICNLIQHPLSRLSTIILNILKQDAITLCIVNIYYDVLM
jgi:hypothetical protein